MQMLKAEPQPTAGLGAVRAVTRTETLAENTVARRQGHSNLKRIRLPNGRPIGGLSTQGDLLVWTRRVLQKHVYRLWHAWTINKGILLQLIYADVVLVRYVAPWGLYEILLEDFVEWCLDDPGGPDGEHIFGVECAKWRFTPQHEQLHLFRLSELR